ncbi:acyltransferase [Microbacterium sp. HD4P20]|uniref:acyltransferase n=1 Tax=Microbacterium sp. HD4P20 TaxID=2864874 RepID=UPI001C64491D|nr:acyltransferase [Microbacterium sp. HD4P20]MCP2638207.1 acyltransferase [Microbacterium sp. HD4P20]
MSRSVAAHEFSPWDFWREADDDAREAQLEWQQSVRAGKSDHEFGAECFLSELASIDNDVLLLGDRTYVAAGAYLTGDLRAGADCSINPYTVIRGRVEVGDGVRIGAHTSILGFNHSMEPGSPVFQQPLTSQGIVIGDDVWIGSHVVILDGVRVGSHSVLAASAVVTKDVPEGAIVGGNPARFIRWRVEPEDTGVAPDAAAEAAARAIDSDRDGAGADVDAPPASPIVNSVEQHSPALAAAPGVTSRSLGMDELQDAAPATQSPGPPPPAPSPPARRTATPAANLETGPGLAERAAAFAQRARAEASVILDRAWRDDLGLFADRPGVAPTVRAQCDAIEIADLLLGTAPTQASAEVQIARLHAWQDAATGAVAPLDATGAQVAGLGFSNDDVAYHVLSAGYALDLLGSAFPAPLTWVTAATPGRVIDFCQSLPWASDAWGAGHHVDGFGTAVLWTRRAGHPIPSGVEEALFGWLLTHADPQSGMWGSASPTEGLLPVVNGFYRATRGTFAQFGMPLPYPERVIDTVLRHARDPRWFAPGARNACNVLDIAHPLWLTRATGYRGDEVRDLASRLLSDALTMWVPDAGFAFREPSAATQGLAETEPGLQGTEMWLAIVWYLADLAGVSDALGYRPRGVHRPEPAGALR